MTSLKTSIKTITYLSDIGCLEIQGASLTIIYPVLSLYPVRMDIEKEGWFQMARKISPDIPVRAVTLTPAQAEYLITGKILPTALFRVPLSPW